MLVVDLVIPCYCLVKQGRVGENLVKAQFHIKTGFIFLFYCHTVFAAAASFNFFRLSWQFQHFSQIMVSWNWPKNSIFSKNCHKNCPFYCQFQVKPAKKKEPSIPIKTDEKKNWFLYKTLLKGRRNKLKKISISF